MNKKILLFGILPVLAICLVAAGLLTYYGQIHQDIEVQSPITVSPDTFMLIEGWAGFVGVVEGEPVTIENIAPMEVEVKISNDNMKPNIDVSYVGELVLSSKDDCYAEGTCTLDDTTTATVYYTVVGDEFLYEVESEDIEVNDYTLIYYPNEGSDYSSASYTGNVIPTDGITTNLPFSVEQDLNAEGDEYCTNGLNPEGSNCNGAKLWLVPTANLNAEKTHIDLWSGDVVLFETDLIQFNTEGNIVMSPGSSLTITPVYDIDSTYIGTTTITTSVEPVA